MELNAKQTNDYLDLNKWCGKILFKSQNEHTRIYLDLDRFQDENDFAENSADKKSFESILTSTVAGIVIHKAHSTDRIFDVVDHQVRLWKARSRTAGYQIAEPPPVIPILLAFVLAAEKMGDDGRSSLDYYSQLLNVLSLPTRLRKDLGNEYRTYAVGYFQLLADWLDEFEGQFGIPSFPDKRSSDEHVEVSIRQALIRSADRRKLERLFQKSNFTANQIMSAEEIESYIEEWDASYAPLSIYFWRHFRNNKTRAVIADAVVGELANWNGTSELKVQSEDENFRLLASVAFTQGIFGIEFSVNMISEMPHQLIDSDWEMVGQKSTEVWFEARSQGTVGLRAPKIFWEDLLKSSMVLTNPQNKHQVIREPDQLLVLNFNSISGSFIEASFVSSGEESLVLCVDLNEKTISDLESYLASHARSGFKKFTNSEVSTLPAGWVLFSKVEIILQSEETPFLKLFPQLSLQSTKPILKLEGGVGLRDNTNTYIEGYLPNVTAISSEYLVLKVKVVNGTTGGVVTEYSSMSGSLSENLNKIEGLGGSVHIQLFLGADPSPVRSTRLFIKSRAWINQNHNSKLIKHSIAPLNLLAAISGEFTVTEPGKNLTFVDLFAGTSVTALGNTLPPAELTYSELPGSKQGNLLVNQNLAHCWVRGSHIWKLEDATGEKRVWDEARCTECKKETRFKTKGKLAGSLTSRSEAATLQESLSHQILIEHSPQVALTPAFDLASIRLLLELVGNGTYQKLSKLLEQFTYASDVRTIVGLLDSMGFINTIRDSYGRLEYWSVNPEISPTSESEKELRLDASRHLASIVPNLSQLADRIPKTTLANSTAMERFDPGSLKFSKVTHAQLPGAYRFITTTGNLYAFLGEATSYQGNLQFGSPQLVKHLHGLHEGKLLISYNSLTQKAHIPIGCELPGLYGKILGVLDETPPTKVRVGGSYFWEHSNIPEDIMVQLSSKLGN